MLTWIRSKLSAAPPEAAMLLHQAEAAYERCALDEARRLCAALLEHRPGEARAMCLMASIAADAGHTEEGLRWAQRAATADPVCAAPHYVAGRLWQGAWPRPKPATDAPWSCCRDTRGRTTISAACGPAGLG